MWTWVKRLMVVVDDRTVGISLYDHGEATSEKSRLDLLLFLLTK